MCMLYIQTQSIYIKVRNINSNFTQIYWVQRDMNSPSTQQLVARVASRINNGLRQQTISKKPSRQFLIRTLDALESDIEQIRASIEERYAQPQDAFQKNWGKITPSQFGLMRRSMYDVVDQTNGNRMKEILYGCQNPQVQPQKSPMKLDYERLYAKSQARYKIHQNKNRNRSKSKIGSLIQKDKFTKNYNNRFFNFVAS